MVSLVLVAHSARLLAALVELIDRTTSPMPPCFIAGGTDDGRMGTSLGRVRAALRAALDATDAGVLVLYDSGSAWLTIGVALDDLTEPDRSRVRLSDAALVEGALAAAARAGDGAPLSEVATAAAAALAGDKRPDADEPASDVTARLTA
jgi:PTS hybrid protein